MNQCDGCRQGAPIKNGLHVDANERAFMVCTKRRYQNSEQCKLCDLTRAKLISRAHWVCADCGRDVSLDYLFWQQADAIFDFDQGKEK